MSTATKCAVCNKPAVKTADGPDITSRLTVDGIEFVHAACVTDLPAADGPYGTSYAAGSLAAS